MSSIAAATDFDAPFDGSNDFGDVGLLQTPTARMRPDGEFGVGASTVRPYNQIHAFVQILPWLETAVRYTDVTDRLYGDQPYSGSQTYKDRSLDFKARLLDEGSWWPSIAFGIQDFGGTGIFGSEYFVGSYHYYDFDFSGGLAWGRLGSRGGIRNPFGLISDHFDKDRSQTDSSASGGTGLSRLFTGHDIGPFGGVQWNMPLRGVALRVEYDGNDYRHEGLGNVFPVALPLNVGIDVKAFQGLNFGIGYERGNTVMARFDLRTNLNNYGGPLKVSDPPPPGPGGSAAPAAANPAAAQANPPVAAASPTPGDAVGASAIPIGDQENFVLGLRKALSSQGFALIAVDYLPATREVVVWISQDRYRSPSKVLGRTARALSATAPEAVRQFVVADVEGGVEAWRAVVPRADFERLARGEISPEQGLSSIELVGPGDGYADAEFRDSTLVPHFSYDMAPALRQSVGGPEGFYFYQIFWRVNGDARLTDHWSFSASAGANIYNNFNQLDQPSNSDLPHVRSDIAQYLKKGADGIIRLESDYIWSPLPDWYARLSGGLFEEMYGGVASELLYRPYGQPWAAGVDVNHLYQRDFHELFAFRSYEVTTGYATLYYHIPYHDILAKLSVGQYLARDKGATLDVSRTFASGVIVGAFATKTNVSAQQFGEGSFDKGLYISLPLDLFLTRSSRRTASLVFRPLTRDGGQMAADGKSLYPLTDTGRTITFGETRNDLLQ